MATPNNGFELPTDAASNAGESINTNFSTLDNGLHFTITIAVAMTDAHFVYIKDTDGKAYKAIASATDTARARGAITEDGTANSSRKIRYMGIVTNTAWNLNLDNPVFLSDTVAGGITQTEPTISVPVGMPLTPTSVLLNIDLSAVKS